MPSSTSSSDRAAWRRFARLLLGMAAASVLLVYLFVVLVDPFGILPVSLPFDRGPVDSNARYAFPMLARDGHFDSVIVGTSTSRLLRPAAFDALFGTRFVNLAMNAATAYEQYRMLDLFVRHHPAPRMIVVGLDPVWCATPTGFQRFTDRPMPEWMYSGSPWRGYFEMADLYSIEKSGQAFAEWTGLKPRVYGRDGYTRFVPDESRYDPARVAAHMGGVTPWSAPEVLGRDPAVWQLPGVDLLRDVLRRLAASTRTVLTFMPHNHRVLATPTTDGGRLLAECKRRIAALATASTTVIDFMRPTPITLSDDNYWDPYHYRVAIADRIVDDIAAALRGEAGADYAALRQDGVQESRDGQRDADAGEVEPREPK